MLTTNFLKELLLYIQAQAHLTVRTDRWFAKGNSKNLLLKHLLGHNQLNVFVIWITICYENLKLLTAHMRTRLVCSSHVVFYFGIFHCMLVFFKKELKLINSN